MPGIEIRKALSAWREAERRLTAAEPGTPERTDAVAASGRAHAEYLSLQGEPRAEALAQAARATRERVLVSRS
jgi:hypothetical protein